MFYNFLERHTGLVILFTMTLGYVLPAIFLTGHARKIWLFWQLLP